MGELERAGVQQARRAALLGRDELLYNQRELAGRGVPVMASAWLPRASAVDLHALLAERGWPEAVVKPAVSASAHGTWRTGLDRAGEDQPRLEELLAQADVLVQPLAPEVARDGEWSFVFLGGAFSHAVLKRPGPGDFRVQSELGGTETAAAPPPALLAQARAITAHIEGPWLYARVDGIDRGGVLTLFELELIEPVLFLAREAGAPPRLAAAILAA
jgi:hypothetical protein